jgi:predicted nucleotidyltransferase
MSEIANVLGSKNCIDVLRRFLFRPDDEKYQSEVVKSSGLSYVTATRCLNQLVAQGLLKDSWRGGLKMYALNVGSPVVRQIKVLLNIAAIYETVKGFADCGFELYVYGSTARGDDTETSDIDLLIIGAIDEQTLAEIVRRIENAMKRDVRLLVKSQVEYAELSRTDSAFYENLTCDRIRLI